MKSMNLFTKNYSKRNLFNFLCVFAIPLLLFSPEIILADTIPPQITVSGNQDISFMTDGSYHTASSFSSGDSIIITAPENKNIYGIYIKWDAPVLPYTILADGTSFQGGTYGFLHEYIPFENGCNKITLQIESNDMKICSLTILDTLEIPEAIQVWNPPVENADICMISAHSDDEILFLGGIIPTYGMEQNAKIQLIYMTEYWTGAKIREHEKLDGLWADGLRNYPVCANLPDYYAETLEEAERIYNLEDATNYLAGAFRYFKPQVIVTHDFNGEYGHGFHQFTAKAVSLALEAAQDNAYTITNSQYASLAPHSIAKAYFHLYPNNPIHLDLHVPLTSMDNMTALDIAKSAYKQHVSQQWCWFYVSDEYEYSCANFGLYHTTVGNDTQNNMLENITTYEEQQKIEEERLLEEQRKEAERQKEEQTMSTVTKETEAIEVISLPVRPRKVPKLNFLFLLIPFGLFIALAILFMQMKINTKKRRKRRRRR